GVGREKLLDLGGGRGHSGRKGATGAKKSVWGDELGCARRGWDIVGHSGTFAVLRCSAGDFGTETRRHRGRREGMSKSARLQGRGVSRLREDGRARGRGGGGRAGVYFCGLWAGGVARAW